MQIAWAVPGAEYQANPPPIVELHLSAKNVVKLDVASSSDPICVAYMRESGEFHEFGRTEVVPNNPNPSWVQSFLVTYRFEIEQRLKFIVYDCDGRDHDLMKHKVVGSVEVDVRTLVASHGKEWRADLVLEGSPEKRGKLCMVVERAQVSSKVLMGQLRSDNLRKVHTFSRNCPFFMITRPSEGGGDLPVYRSEIVPRCLGCTWRDFDILGASVANGDNALPLKVSVYDGKSKREPTLIGSVQKSLKEFKLTVGRPMELTGRPGKSNGTVTFVSLKFGPKVSFYEYVRGGIALNLATAIDFTASNGNVDSPASLHYFCPGKVNAYEACIQAVGTIVCPYDSDQTFPVYGFGAIVDNGVEHCFPLTLTSDPNVHGLEGILNAYREAAKNVVLCGPTQFAPVIRQVAGQSRTAFTKARTYTILMIITDGVIDDMQATIDVIVEASDAPLSILIIGVGNNDFGPMSVLDADDLSLVSSKGVPSRRDIVQFVPFAKYASDPTTLAAELLAEIPRQLELFCQVNHIHIHIKS
jgi:hypothetical protein